MSIEPASSPAAILEITGLCRSKNGAARSPFSSLAPGK
jgi:hypothetical protein